MFRIITVNAEGGQQDGHALAAWLHRQKPLTSPLAALLCEADGPVDAKRPALRTRILTALGSIPGAKRLHHAEGTSHGAREVAVFVLGSSPKHEGHESHQLTPGAGWSGADQDRHVDIDLLTYRRHKIALLSTHAPTGTHTSRGAWAKTPQADLWRKGLAELATIITDLRRRGYRPVLGLDGNEIDSNHPDGLRAWAVAHGLVPFVSGVGWALVDAGLKATAKSLVLPAGISDHKTGLRVDIKVPRFRKPKPVPTPAPHPTPQPQSQSTTSKVIAVATSQVGYHEGYSNGHWNNIEKYAAEVPGLSWANGQAWCDTFVAWCFTKAGALGFLPGGPTASTDQSLANAKKAGRFSEYPAIGAQVIYGHSGNPDHTGIVTAYDATTITTVEGNTNDSGSREGDGVYRKTRQRRDPYVIGYLYPTYPEGLVSADPAWKGRK